MNWPDRILLFLTPFIVTTAIAPMFEGGLYIGSPW